MYFNKVQLVSGITVLVVIAIVAIIVVVAVVAYYMCSHLFGMV